jgi:hypothetical protein
MHTHTHTRTTYVEPEELRSKWLSKLVQLLTELGEEKEPRDFNPAAAASAFRRQADASGVATVRKTTAAQGHVKSNPTADGIVRFETPAACASVSSSPLQRERNCDANCGAHLGDAVARLGELEALLCRQRLRTPEECVLDVLEHEQPAVHLVLLLGSRRHVALDVLSGRPTRIPPRTRLRSRPRERRLRWSPLAVSSLRLIPAVIIVGRTPAASLRTASLRVALRAP